MEAKQIEVIRRRLEELKWSIPELFRRSGVAIPTIKRMLNPKANYNTTTNTINKIATALGIDAMDIYDARVQTNDEYLGINGYIDFMGKITRINNLNDLKKIAKSVEESINAKNEAKKIEKIDKANQKTQSKAPIDTTAIDLFQQESYDTAKLYTWSFRKSDDEKDGDVNDLGNMCKGYPFKVCGEKFLNSECAYISGMFSQNTPKATEIQRELQKSDNGYEAKKAIRRKYEQVGLSRDDWNTFNVQWMLFVVWQKVTQNKKFAEKLRKIPSNAMIVENSTFQKAQKGKDTAAFWGMRNEVIKEATHILETAAEVENFTASKKDVEKAKMVARNKINHVGTWEGVNCMGKILTICKHCLENGTEPPIDYDLLRSKGIYLFGKLLSFEGLPKVQGTTIPEPPSPKQAKAKETPIRKKKVALEVRNQEIPSDVETNFELSEANKVSKEEMLSIKSGELLDRVLNK